MSKQNQYNKSIGITGATGFLGKFICEAIIDQGYHIVALKRKTSSMDLLADLASKIEWIEGDLFDDYALDTLTQKANIIVHAAAKVSFLHKDRHAMFRTNIRGTSNIVNHCIDNSVEHFIHISSIAALGGHGPNITEESQWNESDKKSAYSTSKYQAELEVWRGMAEGLPITILNPSTIVGIGDWETGSSAIFKNVYQGMPFYPNGSNGFVSAKDVAKCVLKSVEKGPYNERFIINGGNLKFKKVFDWITEVYQKPAIKRPIGRGLERILSVVFWFGRKFSPSNVLFSKETLKLANSNSAFNNEKSKEYFDIQYEDMEDCIKSTAKAYLSYKKNKA